MGVKNPVECSVNPEGVWDIPRDTQKQASPEVGHWNFLVE